MKSPPKTQEDLQREIHDLKEENQRLKEEVQKLDHKNDLAEDLERTKNLLTELKNVKITTTKELEECQQQLQEVTLQRDQQTKDI